MGWFDRVEKRFRRFAIPGLTTYLAIGQAFGLILSMTHGDVFDKLGMSAGRVLEGEYWRLFTFMALPPCLNPIFAFFGIYLFFLMGSALEGQWGSFKVNVYVLIGWLATIASAFVGPDQVVTNAAIDGSIFLAFAAFYPDFVFYIMFVLPVKVRWLAILAWIGYAWNFAIGDGMTRCLIALSVLNYLLFFGKEIYRRARYGRKRMVEQVQKLKLKHEPFHTCVECGKTDVSHPRMDFRYCSQCGGLGYCEEHLANHEHRRK